MDLVIGASLGVVALVLYYSTMAHYAFPGESAHLMAVWRGLDFSAETEYPLFAWFAKMFGATNALAPILGVAAVVLVYLLAVRFLGRWIEVENPARASLVRRTGAVTAAVVFMLTPAVHEAATHLEPRLFDTVWALAILALLTSCATLPRWAGMAIAILAGAMTGFGLGDSPLFAALLPFFLFTLWGYSKKRRPFVAVVMYLFIFILVFFIFALNASENFETFLRALKNSFTGYMEPKGWLFVAIFATLPFALTLFAARSSLGKERSWAQFAFHAALTLVAILAVATPLAPSSLLAPYAILPVATSFFAAFFSGYVVAFWALRIFEEAGDFTDRKTALARLSRPLALAMGGLVALTFGFAVLLNFFAFDSDRAEFADAIAEKALDEMGERDWMISDGVLDDHFRLAAERRGMNLKVVSLQRDLDKKYLDRLAKVVEKEQIGGDKNADLSLSLSLGILAFVQDWFASNTDAVSHAVVWGAPDLWYSTATTPVPELLFFGADEKRDVDFKAGWEAFKDILHAPEGWGSYRLAQNKNPVERLRFDLRRHFGLVANNRGVWLQDAKRDAEAFEMYELVLNEIDTDNICALFNEFELARSGEKSAVAKKNAIETKLKNIVDDPDRRYRLWALANYYGYIRSPEIFVRLGYTWAQSGRAGEALQHIKRAIDFIPTDRRTALMNMMAAIYASNSDTRKSREIYEEILAKDSNDHDALIGLMRLELMDGDSAKATEYLARAVNAAGDDPRAIVEVAMLRMMRGELAEARKLLRRATDNDRGNLQAWSFLGAVTMQMLDGEKDAKTRAALMDELENEILRAMEAAAKDPSDYYVQTTRAFILLRKEGDQRRAARDALVAASRERPDIAATGDMILGLDISLNDTVDAERHAMEVLRRNRKAPLANYVMGSLALQRGEMVEAEAFLRRSVEAPRPPVLALNDLAEVLRRADKFEEAEKYARRATETDPSLYVAWETLGVVILERKGNLDEAEKAIKKACDLSKTAEGKPADVRMLVSLARVQLAKGETQRGKGTLRTVRSRIDELSEFERKEFEELEQSVRK